MTEKQLTAILPYKYHKNGVRYLVNNKITSSRPQQYAITSESNITIALFNITGFFALEEELISLGNCYASKDVTCMLYTVNLSNDLRLKAPANDYLWLMSKDLALVDDPLVSTMYVRIQHLNT